MATFDVRDIFTIAMKIEENGQAFYAAMAQQHDNLEIRGLFVFLAEEEGRHRKTFERMRDKLSQHPTVENAPTEYFDYLQAFVDSSIFRQELSQEEQAALQAFPAAIEYAIGREADSILYYHEIKGFVPSSEQPIIEQIIHEERRHYLKLTALAKQLAA